MYRVFALYTKSPHSEVESLGFRVRGGRFGDVWGLEFKFEGFRLKV